jgi:hypothetical protein
MSSMCLGKKTGSKKKSTVIHVPWEKNRELKKSTVIKPVHMSFSWIYCLHELTMLKKSENFYLCFVLSIILYICITFMLELLDLAHKNSKIIPNKS